jgi:hypothetical protein
MLRYRLACFAPRLQEQREGVPHLDSDAYRKLAALEAVESKRLARR